MHACMHQEAEVIPFKNRSKVAVLLGIALILIAIILPLFPFQIAMSIPLEANNDKLANSSEIRFGWIGARGMWGGFDWDYIYDLLQSYNINCIMAKLGYTDGGWYSGRHIRNWLAPTDVLREMMDYAQGRNPPMKVFYSPGILHGGYDISAECLPLRCMTSGGSYVNWFNPFDPILRQRWKEIFESVIMDYDVDGIMLDYMRYDGGNFPYNPSVRVKFEEYLGETIPETEFPGEFAPGGDRYNEFLALRVRMLNDFTKELVDYARSLKPTIEIGSYTWGWGETGQDWGWQAFRGLADFWSSDGYTETNSVLQTKIRTALGALDGPEGIIPHTIFLRHRTPDASSRIKTPEQLASQIDLLRAEEDDGWTSYMIADGIANAPWAGAQPGQYGYANYQDYLSLISLPETFKLRNIYATSGANSITLTWDTLNDRGEPVPATTKVEYSESPLFEEQKLSTPPQLTVINHIQGQIVEDTNPVSSHSVVLTGLLQDTTYYLRVQSSDASGIATSKVYEVSTSSIPTARAVVNARAGIKYLEQITKEKSYLTIEPTVNGSLSLDPGKYEYMKGETAVITAIPDVGFRLDYFVLNGTNVPSDTNSISILMDNNYILGATFTEIPPIFQHPTFSGTAETDNDLLASQGKPNIIVVEVSQPSTLSRARERELSL